jgi:hypothetical protein
MSKTRDNHYVPIWYQKGFVPEGKERLRYLCLQPTVIRLPSAGNKEIYSKKWYYPSQCFYQTDLYTTFFGQHINDDIERLMFGQVDRSGSNAVRSFISGDPVRQHESFEDFFTYIDTQKVRTPKGLAWIGQHYSSLNQTELMIEMQSVRAMHCTIWTEGVREIVSAKKSNVKFIISDHPVTVYNYACAPNSEYCSYPNDPNVALKASQTIYPLDQNNALILTNLEYAQEPEGAEPLEQRTHAKKVRQSMVRTDAFIRTRDLTTDEVQKINFILKSRAKKFIAAGEDDWLYPEEHVKCEWAALRSVLLPPKSELYIFGGEMFAQFEDGSTYYQDAFGRRTPENKHLNKDVDEKVIGRNDICGCGSGKKYKKCCEDIPVELRTTWKAKSIRERNLILYNAIFSILGFCDGKTWDDVRRELNEDQIKEIYGLYGSLWPIETDIYELLPRPDKKLRGLYTGVVDSRTIGGVALSMTSCFDELLIEHPFVNPNNVKPEFSPLESPNTFKYQALKDIFLLLGLEPFVREGFVNLFPDPCNFDYHLHRQMLDMANQRRGFAEISQKDQELSFRLHKENFLHTITMLPDGMKERHIRSAFPGISGDELQQATQYLRDFAEEDPLALLQEVHLGDGGQFLISKMAPNYEMGLFIAQTTGAVIVTDSETRWGELIKSQFREYGLTSYPWHNLSSVFTEVPLYLEPDDIFDNRSNSHYSAVRRTLNEINLMVRECSVDADRVAKLERQLTVSLGEIAEESKKKQTHTAKMKMLMPKGGFRDNNVQRLLLKSNCEHYLPCVAMAMYVEPDIS